MESLHSFVSQRQQGLLPRNVFSRAVRDSLYLVKRLTNTRVLEGHNGCVNSVSWNETGTRLISGSDDCHINIYDMATGLTCHSFHTSHQSNIFSAKFLPQTGDCKAVSCAGIGSVEVSELSPYGDYVAHQFKCQSSITYQVATSPGCPHEFFTCEELGMVRLYDLRTSSSCHCDGNCNRSMLCRFPSAVTSMSVHPLEPHYVVVGLGDGTLRLLDRRRSDTWQDPAPDSPLQVLHASSAPVKYRPAAIRDQKLKITSVNFNADGSQIVASYSEDYVYLFNSGIRGSSNFGLAPPQISRPQYLSQFERYPGRGQKRHCTKSQQRDSCDNTDSPPLHYNVASSSEGAVGGRRRVAPGHKRIRLRGDWSDTGPEARPEDQVSEEPEEGEGGGGGRGSLMNRMSRLFERWVDMALDSVSGDEGEGEVEGEGNGEGRDEGESSEVEEMDRRENNPDLDEQSPESWTLNEPDGERVADEESVLLETPSNNHGESDRDSGVVDQANPHHDLRLAQDAVEVAMVNVVTEAVHQAMGDSLSLSPGEETQDVQNSAVSQGTVEVATASESNRPVGNHTDAHRSENAATDTTRTSETGASLYYSVELNPLPDDALVSPINHSVPTSPLLENVRETSPSGSPSSVRGRRSRDRSPDHSYQRSRFRAQRRRGERSRGVAGRGSEVGEKGEREGEEDTGGRRFKPFRESYPQLQPFMVYKGHRNSRTMIKQANFFGDNWVMSGSDCGRVFVWDKWTGEVVNMFTADTYVVNCVQPHPSAYLIATSGIDYNVKLWEPVADQEASLSDLDEVYTYEITAHA
ncbi:DDB1- and CUL4-associated factor 6 [Geodia barretti]|uniref:DDB1- and CUL4-associated factor 6 n=1 Tax=Geodia barretti TaxID=519541 RepID=A0AA35WN38_GEOBA|nr:DDB1- and CUL4-associated factor 6 [Geodia barretti]